MYKAKIKTDIEIIILTFIKIKYIIVPIMLPTTPATISSFDCQTSASVLFAPNLTVCTTSTKYAKIKQKKEVKNICKKLPDEPISKKFG